MTESHDDTVNPEEEIPTPERDEQGREVMYPASHPDSAPKIQPGIGGYDDRDPATDVPRMPSQPETQDD